MFLLIIFYLNSDKEVQGLLETFHLLIIQNMGFMPSVIYAFYHFIACMSDNRIILRSEGIQWSKFYSIWNSISTCKVLSFIFFIC